MTICASDPPATFYLPYRQQAALSEFMTFDASTHG